MAEAGKELNLNPEEIIKEAHSKRFQYKYSDEWMLDIVKIVEYKASHIIASKNEEVERLKFERDDFRKECGEVAIRNLRLKKDISEKDKQIQELKEDVIAEINFCGHIKARLKIQGKKIIVTDVINVYGDRMNENNCIIQTHN